MRRTVPYVAFAATSLLVVTVVVATLWALGSATGDREKFSSLQIAPKDSAFYVAINTDPTSPQWIAVADALETINAKDPIREAIDEALLEFGLEFERDILPLAGDEGYLAITDMEALSAETGGLVVAFRLRDTEKAEQIALDVAEHEGTVFTEEEYEGVTIRETEELSEDEAGALAFVQDVMVLGISRQDVRDVIDIIHGRAENAEGDGRLRELADRQEDDFLMWGYADLAPLWEMVEGNLPAQIGEESAPEFSESGEVDVVYPPESETGFRIPAFDADYRVEGGALHVTERITADFGDTPRSGFNRDISKRLTYDFVDDVIVQHIDAVSVTKDGTSQPFEQASYGGEYERIIIGDPNATITGQHTYELNYIARGALIDLGDDEGFSSYDLVWNVTGDNWGVPVEKASAKLTIPGENFLYTPCSAGPEAYAAFQLGCTMTQEGITTVRFDSVDTIEPRAAMVFMASVNGESGATEPAVLVPSADAPFADEEFESYGEEAYGLPFTFNTEELMEEVRGAYDRASFSIASTGDGFALDVNILHAADYEPKYALEPTQAFDTHFADSVPADTMFYYAGYNLYEQSWLPLRDYLKDAEWEDGTTFDDYLEQFRDETGLDLEEDILALLTGEYAIAGNVSNFEADTPEFSILAMLDVSDAERAQQSLDKLGEYLETQHSVEVDVENGVQRWTVLGSNAEVLGLTLSEDSLIAGYPDSAVEDFVAGADESLAGTDDWKRAMGMLPDDTTSVGFLSISRILQEVHQVDDARRSFEESTEGKVTLEDLEPIRSIGMATAEIEGGWQFRAVLLIDEE